VKSAWTLAATAAILLSGCNNSGVAFKPIAPTAVITGPALYRPLDTAQFDGSSSYVKDNTIAGYAWSIVGRPSGSISQPVVDPGNPAKVSLWLDFAGDYVIELKVTDQRGMTGVADYPFQAVPWQALHVELGWDKADTDLDVHLVSDDEGGNFFAKPFDCYFDNTNPDWGTPGVTADDPAIDIDDVDGFGPENVSLEQPLDGHHYHVLVHYYDDHGHGSTNATVRIYLNGELRYEGIQALAHKDVGWDVARISWPAGAIDGVGTAFEYTPN